MFLGAIVFKEEQELERSGTNLDCKRVGDAAKVSVRLRLALSKRKLSSGTR